MASADGESPDPDHPLNRFAGQLQRIAQGVVNGAPLGWRRIPLARRPYVRSMDCSSEDEKEAEYEEVKTKSPRIKKS